MELDAHEVHEHVLERRSEDGVHHCQDDELATHARQRLDEVEPDVSPDRRWNGQQ